MHSSGYPSADYLEALHLARATALRAALERDGGWPLHIDTTGVSIDEVVERVMRVVAAPR